MSDPFSFLARTPSPISRYASCPESQEPQENSTPDTGYWLSGLGFIWRLVREIFNPFDRPP